MEFSPKRRMSRIRIRNDHHLANLSSGQFKLTSSELGRQPESLEVFGSQRNEEMAEGAGFEPARGLNTPNPLSRRAH